MKVILLAAALAASSHSSAYARHYVAPLYQQQAQVTRLRTSVRYERSQTWYWQQRAGVAKTRTQFAERHATATVYLAHLRHIWAVRKDAARRYALSHVSVPSGGGSICWSCWARVAQCESGGNPRTNTGNGFEGAVQFVNSTWVANGGLRYARHAYDATYTQQILVAERIRRQSGLGAWPVCGKRYYG